MEECMCSVHLRNAKLPENEGKEFLKCYCTDEECPHKDVDKKTLKEQNLK